MQLPQIKSQARVHNNSEMINVPVGSHTINMSGMDPRSIGRTPIIEEVTKENFFTKD
jgi:hypothetical protein